MKVPVAALALLLCIVAPCAQVFSSPVGADTPTACCFSYALRQIPRRFIADYYETSSQCSKPGIIFITKKGYPICANPRDDWVQDYIKDMEEN
ncbi:C-C motif chemokine 3-like [Dugong dugon]